MNLDFAAAVFADLPRKQKPRTHAFSQHRAFTFEDLEKFADRQINANRVIGNITKDTFHRFSDELCRALCNAGPHVVDVRVRVGSDVDRCEMIVSMASPLIPSEVYGASVHVDELKMRRGSTPASAATEAPASFWNRAKSFIAAEWKKTATNPGDEYDGPRGWRDAA